MHHTVAPGFVDRSRWSDGAAGQMERYAGWWTKNGMIKLPSLQTKIKEVGKHNNNMKGRKAYTTYRNNTSPQRQFKTGIPQGDILSPTLFNIYTADIPPPSVAVQVMAYTFDITITSTHRSTSATKKYIQPYLHKVFPGQNNLHSVHSRPCRI